MTEAKNVRANKDETNFRRWGLLKCNSLVTAILKESTCQLGYADPVVVVNKLGRSRNFENTPKQVLHSFRRRSLVHHAKNRCPPRYESASWRSYQRSPPTCLLICRPKPKPVSPSPVPGPIAAQHIWSLYTSDNCQKPMHRNRQRSRYYE